MPKNERARRKQAEKRERKREQAKAKAKAQALPTSPAELVELAARGDFGPAWVTVALGSDPAEPEIATVVVTRKLPRGRWLAHLVLVDRTCLGVKEAFTLGPVTLDEVFERVAELRREGNPLGPCEPAWAQSIVLHALDYAASLGFSPHRDFALALVLPRPEPLLDTPLARPTRPVYVEGPHDSRDRILRQLVARVGVEGFDCVVWRPDEDEEDGEYDDFEDDELALERRESRPLPTPPYHEDDPEIVARTVVRHYLRGESLELLAGQLEDEDGEPTIAAEIDDWHYEAADALEPLVDAMQAEAGATHRYSKSDELDVDGIFTAILEGCHAHGLEPREYLRDIFLLQRVWPEENILALTPAHWPQTLADEATAETLAELRRRADVVVDDEDEDEGEDEP